MVSGGWGLDAANLRQRACALRAIRAWFDQAGYLEVQTPALVPAAALEEHLYPIAAGDGALRTSPEFALKRVVASGVSRVYELGPCFRDRESGAWHSREFTMLEWYRVGASLPDLMDEVEQLVDAVARALGAPAIGPWQRLTIAQAFQRAIGVDVFASTPQQLSGVDEPWDDAFFRRFVNDVEPQLTEPTFLYDWPASQAALARVVYRAGRPTALRFEGYLGGVELCNAFDELGDATTLRERLQTANASRAALGEPPHPVDEPFLAALDRLPPCAGIALGVDRLIAVLAGWPGVHPGRVTPWPLQT